METNQLEQLLESGGVSRRASELLKKKTTWPLGPDVSFKIEQSLLLSLVRA